MSFVISRNVKDGREFFAGASPDGYVATSPIIFGAFEFVTKDDAEGFCETLNEAGIEGFTPSEIWGGTSDNLRVDA